MELLTVGQDAARSGWSPRMLRYLEDHPRTFKTAAAD